MHVWDSATCPHMLSLPLAHTSFLIKTLLFQVCNHTP
jgi:hypothetical protein